MRTGFFVRVDSFNIKGFIENKQDNFMIHCALGIPRNIERSVLFPERLSPLITLIKSLSLYASKLDIYSV